MYKILPISLITSTVPSMITLLLITFGAISVVGAIEVVVEDGTISEAEDMAKALALSKTHFWRHMIPAWECFSDQINSRDKLGFQSIGEMDHFCLKWKDMAWAAYVNVLSWECQNGTNVTDGSSSSTALKPINEKLLRLSIKPVFLVKEGQLRMSSAMQAIESVYRDLFRWGNGNGMKIKIDFNNQHEWDEIFKRISKTELAGQYNEAAEREGRKALLDSCIKVANNLKKQLDKLVVESTNDNFNAANQSIQKLWDDGQQLGFDMEAICTAYKNAKQMMDEAKMDKEIGTKIGNLINNLNNLSQSQIRDGFEHCSKIERDLGAFLFFYKHRIEAPIMEKHPKMKALMIKDPCEEAKLKVIKIGQTDQSKMIEGQAKVIKNGDNMHSELINNNRIKLLPSKTTKNMNDQTNTKMTTAKNNQPVKKLSTSDEQSNSNKNAKNQSSKVIKNDSEQSSKVIKNGVKSDQSPEVIKNGKSDQNGKSGKSNKNGQMKSAEKSMNKANNANGTKVMKKGAK